MMWGFSSLEYHDSIYKNMSTAYVPGIGSGAFVITIPPEVDPGPAIQGTGSPEGTVEANPGTAYTDSVTQDLYIKIAGVQSLGWALAGKSV